VRTRNGSSTPRARTYFGYHGKEVPHYYHPETGAFLYRPPRPHVLPLDNGDEPLRFVRLNFPSSQNLEGMFREVLTDWVHALTKIGSMRLKILVNEGDQARLAALMQDLPPGLRARIEPVPIAGDNHVRPWPRDPSVLLAGGRKLLLPRARMLGHEEEEHEHPQRIADYFGVVEKYAHAAGLPLERSAFRFEGGNILVGRRHVFVGSDIVQNAMADYDITEEEAVAALSREFGRPVLSIGRRDAQHPRSELRQPRQHIDLAMAVVRDRRSGREVVLLESPKLARDLLGDRLGSVEPEGALWRDDENSEADFDAARRALRGEGYEVIDVPGLTTGWASSLNYTNAVLASGHAMIPQLDIPELDVYAANVYRRLGYEVIPMRSARRSLELNGGPRCLGEHCR